MRPTRKRRKKRTPFCTLEQKGLGEKDGAFEFIVNKSNTSKTLKKLKKKAPSFVNQSDVGYYFAFNCLFRVPRIP